MIGVLKLSKIMCCCISNGLITMLNGKTEKHLHRFEDIQFGNHEHSARTKAIRSHHQTVRGGQHTVDQSQRRESSHAWQPSRQHQRLHSKDHPDDSAREQSQQSIETGNESNVGAPECACARRHDAGKAKCLEQRPQRQGSQKQKPAAHFARHKSTSTIPRAEYSKEWQGVMPHVQPGVL